MVLSTSPCAPPGKRTIGRQRTRGEKAHIAGVKRYVFTAGNTKQQREGFPASSICWEWMRGVCSATRGVHIQKGCDRDTQAPPKGLTPSLRTKTRTVSRNTTQAREIIACSETTKTLHRTQKCQLKGGRAGSIWSHSHRSLASWRCYAWSETGRRRSLAGPARRGSSRHRHRRLLHCRPYLPPQYAPASRTAGRRTRRIKEGMDSVHSFANRKSYKRSRARAGQSMCRLTLPPPSPPPSGPHRRPGARAVRRLATHGQNETTSRKDSKPPQRRRPNTPHRVKRLIPPPPPKHNRRETLNPAPNPCFCIHTHQHDRCPT